MAEGNVRLFMESWFALDQILEKHCFKISEKKDERAGKKTSGMIRGSRRFRV